MTDGATTPLRSVGNYWVRSADHWFIAHWGGGHPQSWWTRSENSPFSDHAFDEIDERPITRPLVSPTPAVDASLVERLRGLVSKATPGPWRTDASLGDESVFGRSEMVADCAVFGRRRTHDINRGNAALIVAMHEALPALLAAPAGRADAWRLGAEAMREAAAKWHDLMALAAAPGTGHAAKHEWYAEQIRALPTPPTHEPRGGQTEEG